MKDLNKYLIENSKLVKINSQEIKSGDVFIALSGKTSHGNKYILDALNKGAKYIITDSIPDKNISNKNLIIVENTLSFLMKIANQKRNLYQGKVIGITGSIGKTSVKENLKYFLFPYYKISVSIKSYNNYLGVIISLINLDLHSQFAIFELGTNNFLEIRKLTSIVMPSQVIITNILSTHLEKLINTKNIAKEKSDIFNKIYNPNIELVILPNNNLDEKFIIAKARKNNINKIITFGKGSNSDLKVSKINNIDDIYSKISLGYKEEKKIDLIINQNQIHRLDNISICLLIFLFNNIKLDLFISLTKNIPLIEGRGLLNKIILNNKKINFIDESYNASPQSMRICIDYLKKIKTTKNQRKFLILGEMKELGKNTLKFHIDLLNYTSDQNLENVIICGEIMKTALEKSDNNKIFFMPNVESILDYLKKTLNNNDIILIKGSNTSLSNKLAKEFLKGRAN